MENSPSQPAPNFLPVQHGENKFLAIEICKLVRTKQPRAPKTHKLPQIAVVANDNKMEVFILAGNFPALSNKGRVLARTLHWNSWKDKYGSDPNYRDCVEVEDVYDNPPVGAWSYALGQVRGMGYTVILSGKFE